MNVVRSTLAPRLNTGLQRPHRDPEFCTQLLGRVPTLLTQGLPSAREMARQPEIMAQADNGRFGQQFSSAACDASPVQGFRDVPVAHVRGESGDLGHGFRRCPARQVPGPARATGSSSTVLPPRMRS